MREPFLWGNAGQQLTPKQVAERKAIAEALLAKAGDTSPVGHWTAALNRGLQGLSASMERGAARSGEEAGLADFRAKMGARQSGGASIANALAGGGPPVSTDSGTPTQFTGDRQQFIEMMAPLAIAESQRTGVAPEIIIAQAAQETGWGRSAPNNNFFGIKSHGKSGGGTFATTEYINGQPVTINDSFRGYESPADSVRGYGDFLMTNPRYKAMLEAGDMESQLSALGASGYATDPNYARSVGSIAKSLDLSPYTSPSGVGSYPSASSGNVSQIAELLAHPWAAEAGAAPVLEAEMNAQMQAQAAEREMAMRQQDPMYQAQLQAQLRENELAMQPQADKIRYEVMPNGELVAINETQGAVQGMGNYAPAPEAGYTRLSPEQVVEFGLDQNKQWQVSPDNKIEQIGGGGVNVNVGGEKPTKFSEKLDETFAPEAMAWLQGGESKVMGDIAKLDEAIGLLESGAAATGLMGAIPPQLQAFLNTDGTIARENVQSVVQESMRQILGSAFTEREGEAILARAFNPLLPPAENIKRVRRLMQQITGAAEAKRAMTAYAMENGTLRGYTGPQPGAGMFDVGTADEIKAFRGTTSGPAQVGDGVWRDGEITIRQVD